MSLFAVFALSFWALLGPILELGLGNCSKITFWELPGHILRPGLGHASKLLSGSFLGPFCGLGLEMLQMMCWELPGPILLPGLGNALKGGSGGFPGSFCGLGLQMLQNGFLGASWAHSAAWVWKCFKIASWGLRSRICRKNSTPRAWVA